MCAKLVVSLSKTRIWNVCKREQLYNGKCACENAKEQTREKEIEEQEKF